MKIAVFIGGMMYEAQSRLVEGIIKYAGGEFQIYSLPDLTQYDGVI